MAKAAERPQTPQAWADAVIWERRLAAGAARVEVVSTSMAPLARRGDALEVTAASTARVGDVVLIAGAERVLVHRVIRRPPTGEYITKGDGSPVADPPQHPDSILGVATHLLKASGRRIPLTSAWNRRVAGAAVSISRAEGALSGRGIASAFTRRFFYLIQRVAILALVS